MMESGCSRRIFTAGRYLGDLFYLVTRFPVIVAAMHDKRIGKAFMEKIFMVVTAVNGCTYCTWFHAKAAIASGISEDKVRNMLDLQFHAHASQSEMMALLHAQHCAETNRHPEPDMDRRLVEAYGPKTAGHVVAIIRVIFFGNLLGNTFDAFISRLKGVRAPGSNVVFEAIVFLLHAVILLPVRPLTRAYRSTTT